MSPTEPSREFIESWKSGPHSTQFYTRTYTPTNAPRAAIVFIHGFAEHIGRYTRFHSLVCQRDIAVFSFDQRGFGKTALDTEGHRSRESGYGKTSWEQQMSDIDWAIEHTQQTFSGVPIFLMGQSMGGGEVLGFATSSGESKYAKTVSSLAGIIAASPLILQTYPASRILRWVGGKTSSVLPNQSIPATVKPHHLSRDVTVNDAYMKDPLVGRSGSLLGIHTMLSNGEALLTTYYKHWPKSLPLLLVHGTEDKITSCKATQTFYDKISARDKKLKLFEGAFHELQNEPDSVKDEVFTEVVAFIEAHSLAVDHSITAVEERSKM